MRKNSKVRILLLILTAILAVGSQAIIALIPNGGNIIVPLKDSQSVSRVNLNGVLQSIESLFCIVMVCIDVKRGIHISRILMVISLFGVSRSVFLDKNLTAIPGMLISVISIFSCEVIKRALDATELENITDYVTRLLNRKGLLKELSKRGTKKEHFHMMFIHIRNNKSVNDSLGYEYGDTAISEIAQRIKLAAGHKSIVGKLDGTEFAIALPIDVDVKEKAEEIMKAVSRVVILESSEGIPAKFYMQAYAGVATYPDDADTILKLMRYADIAMYHASKNNDERIVFFNKGLEQEILRRSKIEGYIQDSIKYGYFYPVYQPQFKAVDKSLRGFETLIRMRLPDGTNISPGEFIPIAEKTDLIYKIDDYVLKRAMIDFKEIIDKTKNKFVVSVNVSAKDISNPDFSNKVRGMIEETGFDATCLEIEITEYSLYDSLERTVANIMDLRRIGVKFALDDFGTGYTSLSQLLKLPFDLLKVDKSLVDNIETSEVSRDFVNLVIYMGHMMNSEVIAEGVETESQLKLLYNQECDFIQGYVWSRPLTLEDATRLCRDYNK